MKNYLITGASSGIGFETASYLANNGDNVLAVARTQPKLEKLKSKNSERINIITEDITKQSSVDKITGFLNDKSVKLDGIMNNAGLLINKPFTELTDKDWEMQLQVNLMGPVKLVRALLPHFNKNAHILNISSMGGFMGSSKFPGLSAYSVSKGALSILTECLAVELADQNINCNCLCFGAVQTEMLEQAFPGLKAPVTAEEMGMYAGDFLSGGHKFYNGQVLPVTLADPG